MPILVGTSSWTDRTLVEETDFYPSRSMSAEERLRYYSSIFPVVEVDATYYAPPSTRVAELWAERTPPGFRMEIKAYSLLTGHPAPARTLWKDVAADVPDEHADKRNIYLNHLPDAAVDRAWEHFGSALEPLREAGKLGAVVFQFPPWFTSKRANREYIESLPARLPGVHVAVEFRHGSWFDERDTDRTLELLGSLGITYVCVDEPQGFKTSVPPVMAVTSPDLAMVRFHGHNRDTWQKKGISAAERFRYLYDDDELAEWVDPIRSLAGDARETHVLMNNCYQDYGVRNARQLATLLGEGLQPDAPSD